MALAFHGASKYGLSRFLHIPEAEQSKPPSNFRAFAHRGRKTHTIQSVIDCRLCAAADSKNVLDKAAYQRKRKESMCNRSLIRRFSLGPLAIHVNPLPVFGGFRKPVDALLRDNHPLA